MDMSVNEYNRVWVKLCGEEDDHVSSMRRDRLRGGRSGEQAIRAIGRYKLYCFSERLNAEYACPWTSMKGHESVKLYLLNKHHWQREAVEFLKEQDLMYLLHAELIEMKLNEIESYPVHQWGCQDEAWLLIEPHIHPA
ncbi:hypothetical protein [Pseudomonas oryzihabitans]|uniref:hypothetical protein n=1 Tax=Pseudomonas oryzihabitans TaxID=47885 RepID=UPI00241F2735|nr:hypothetical protein [Pseudomonas oryzihabitans]